MLATDVLRFGHSPDPDDAFMFYGFAQGAVLVREHPVQHVLEDIESLNRRAVRGELEITAVSAHAYGHLTNRYWAMRTGASVGRGYGPIVVSREPTELEALRERSVALPGEGTTAALVFGLYAPPCQARQVAFDQILDEVREGRVDAGVIIHEGQLTFEDYGVHKVADLGVLWREDTGLPLPLGLDVVRADLGEDLARDICKALRRSIEYAYENEEEALTYALEFGRGLDRELGRKFIRMYVNDDTLDIGKEGEAALKLLHKRGAERGFLPGGVEPRFVG
jgi:1,4-dihydroxy-6-naphthoate synthase